MPRTFDSVVWLALCLLAALMGEGRSFAADPPAASEAGGGRVDLTERNRLWNDARRLESQGKIDEALIGANKVLAIDRTKYGAKDQRVAVSLDYVAKLNLVKGDFAAAREARRGALSIWQAVPGAAAWRVTDARLALADVDVLEKLTKPQRADLAKSDAAEESAEQAFRDAKFEQGATEARAAFGKLARQFSAPTTVARSPARSCWPTAWPAKESTPRRPRFSSTSSRRA